jgi:hypothetical protein
MSDAEDIHTAVKERFAAVARSPDQEQKFPVGPASAKKLGYDPTEIDTLPASVTESFCGVGNPLGLGEAPDEGSGTWLHRPCLWRTLARHGTLPGVTKPLAAPARSQDHERSEPDR